MIYSTSRVSLLLASLGLMLHTSFLLCYVVYMPAFEAFRKCRRNHAIGVISTGRESEHRSAAHHEWGYSRRTTVKRAYPRRWACVPSWKGAAGGRLQYSSTVGRKRGKHG